MQAKDIPTVDFLEFLYLKQGKWTMIWEVQEAFQQFPEKVVQAKFRAMNRRGLIGGCPCGCRGDLEITDKGLMLLGKPRLKPYTGY